MQYTIDQLIISFCFYSFVGWAWETVYCSLKEQKFQYRGFLYGPYCPVYGFAVCAVLVTTQFCGHNVILIFLNGVVVATVFEYVASVFLETAFHLKLWDYSKLWGNLNGRVAPAISAFWGFGVVFLVLVIQPRVMRIVDWIHFHFGGAAASVIVVVMGVDTVISVIHVRQFQDYAQQLEGQINARRRELAAEAKIDFIRDHPESVAKLEQLNDFHDQVNRRVAKWRSQVVTELRQHQLKSPNWHERWMLRNYPQLRFTRAPRLHDLRDELMKRHVDFKKR